MIKVPAFNPSLQIECLELEGLVALGEERELFLAGKLYCLLAPLIDGRRSTDEVVGMLMGKADPAEVYYALLMLEKNDYIIEATSDLPTEDAAFWYSLGIDAREAVQCLQSSRVALTALGSINPEPYVESLRSLQITVVDDADFHLVLTDDYLREELATYNTRAITERRPWILARPVGLSLWLGPLFVPGQALGCWECLAERLRHNRSKERLLQEQRHTRSPIAPIRAALSTTSQLAANLVALEVGLWLVTNKSERLQGAIVTLSLPLLETQRHPLTWRPQCPICGISDYATKHSPMPVHLSSRPTTLVNDAGVRVVTPEETIETYSHLISPITGIVSQLLEYPIGSSGSPVYLYGGIVAETFIRAGLHSWKHHLLAGGKGTSREQAKTSCLCEAIERHCACFRGDEYSRLARIQDFGPDAIHPAHLLQFSEKQYCEREMYNCHYADSKYRVPIPFDQNKAINWTPVWSLTHEVFHWVPTSFCYFGHFQTGIPPFCGADSNGNAAGNTLEEAILQGLMELVERDASSIWWSNRICRPALDLASFQESYVERLLSFYESFSRDLWVLDITTDLNIPTFVAVSRQCGQANEHIITGFGAHLNPRIALLRALTECNQNLLFAVRPESHSADAKNQEKMHWLRTVTLAEHPYLAPNSSLPARQCMDYTNLETGDLRIDLLWCQRKLQELGLELMVLDQTRPDIQLSVTKVIVPGLCHPWRRLAPSRLYDVPVKLSWLSAPLTEDKINPTPIL